jgi:hypothetical protein
MSVKQFAATWSAILLFSIAFWFVVIAFVPGLIILAMLALFFVWVLWISK